MVFNIYLITDYRMYSFPEWYEKVCVSLLYLQKKNYIKISFFPRGIKTFGVDELI